MNTCYMYNYFTDMLQDNKPPSTKLKSPMPEAESTSWTQSDVIATKPAAEIKVDKVTDNNVKEYKKVSAYRLVSHFAMSLCYCENTVIWLAGYCIPLDNIHHMISSAYSFSVSQIQYCV